MIDLSGRDIPRLAASLQLAAQSASLASQGPALLASRNQEMLDERTRKMKETQQITLGKIGEIIELGADKAIVDALDETVKNIDDTIQKLGRGSPRAAGGRGPARQAIRCPAQGTGKLRRRREPGDAGRPNPDQRHLRVRQPFP